MIRLPVANIPGLSVLFWCLARLVGSFRGREQENKYGAHKGENLTKVSAIYLNY